MTIRTTIVASTALLALAACSRGSEGTQANTTTVQTSETTGAAPAPQASERASTGFVNAAAASDACEIETSRLALANGASAAVKSYAQKMIDAHTASTAKLKTVAAGLAPAMTPSPALSPEQQEKVDQLKTIRGSAFDQAYIAGQAAGHPDGTG